MNHEGMDRNAFQKQIEIPGTEILVEKLLIWPEPGDFYMPVWWLSLKAMLGDGVT